MTACRLQSPNWWRTARDALAAARALLDDVPPGRPTGDATGNQMRAVGDDPVLRVAAAVRWSFEAAVALRLPYAALQPAEAWALGWRGACWEQDTVSAGGDFTIATCRAVLVGGGARCRRIGLAPDRLAAALDPAEHAHVVCYTERRSLL